MGECFSIKYNSSWVSLVDEEAVIRISDLGNVSSYKCRTYRDKNIEPLCQSGTTQLLVYLPNIVEQFLKRYYQW